MQQLASGMRLPSPLLKVKSSGWLSSRDVPYVSKVDVRQAVNTTFRCTPIALLQFPFLRRDLRAAKAVDHDERVMN